MNTRCAALMALMMITSMTLAATQDVGGCVTNQNGDPLEFVNVSLLSADSIYIQGATTNDKGRFLIESPVKGCILRLSYIGYHTRYIDVNDANVGTIRMEEDKQLLSEIIVKGQMPKTKLTGNSMVTTVQGTILGQSGTAQEMLAKVPGMTAKGEELEVLGKGTPIIYINGRKMQDKNELKQLRSEEIQSVEVITNPGALYDATVSSVVRIKTIRREGDGFGYDLSLGNSQDLTFGQSDPNAQLNLRYRHNNLDLFGMVNYWKWDEVTRFYDTSSFFLPSDHGVKSILQDSHSKNHYHDNGIDCNLGFNWQIAEGHSMGARITRHDRFDAGTDLTVDTDIEHRYPNAPDIVKENNASDQHEHRRTPYSWEGNAYYNGQAGKLGIDLNVDFVSNELNVENDIDELKDYSIRNTMIQENRSTSRLWATKLVLTYPIWKGRLEAGTEMSFVSRSNSSSITNYPLPSSDSKVKESNVAAFAAYNVELQKVGSISAGVRYEHVGFDYTDYLDAGNNRKRYQDELFPNISWARSFGPVQTSLAYNFRTIRPNYQDLSDRITYINSYMLFQGDPTLKNATMQEVSLNARYKWVNLFAAYERRDNTLSQLPFAYNNEGVVIMKRVNLSDPVRNLAVFLSANPTFGVWSPNWTVGGQKFWNTMEFDDPREATGKVKETYTKPIFFFDINNAFRFRHSWQLEANTTIQTKGDVINFRMTSASYNLGFVVQKCWLQNDALCLRASISDVLQRSVQDMGQDCGAYRFDESKVRSSHRLAVSLRYTFNATKSKYKGTGAGKAEQARFN